MAAPKKPETKISVPADVIDEAVAPAATVEPIVADADDVPTSLDRFHEVLEQVRGFASHLVPTERAVVHALLSELQTEYEIQ